MSHLITFSIILSLSAEDRRGNSNCTAARTANWCQETPKISDRRQPVCLPIRKWFCEHCQETAMTGDQVMDRPPHARSVLIRAFYILSDVAARFEQQISSKCCRYLYTAMCRHSWPYSTMHSYSQMLGTAGERWTCYHHLAGSGETLS